MNENIELTILMPCLNEAETLEICIKKAKKFLETSGVKGEVLISDNGSTDGSQEIAERNGARVVSTTKRGYGAALINGCNEAYGKYVIMGDADDSYDFLHLMPFVEKLREGYDLVMGNRFKGGIEKGAMPPLHRYIGNPVLSFIGRLFFPSKIKDFHCGLRGYNRESIMALNLNTTGMEYASEMVVQATLHKYKMAEVPTTLKKDGRTRPPHLRSWSDGWRHLSFLLIHSPNWLYFYPGIILFVFGTIATIALSITPISIGSVTFDINTLLYTGMCVIVGLQLIMFSLFVRTYARNTGFIPVGKTNRVLERFTMNLGVLIGAVLTLVGLILSIVAVNIWSVASFDTLEPQNVMRVTIPSLVLIVCGIEILFSSFFIGVLNTKHK